MDLKRAEQIIQDYHELKNLVDAAGRKNPWWIPLRNKSG